ncbi:DUF4349 domain-containing protein [Thiolinea disciformis]|uniref:DUF4349 domain-containing protein n=1 Tax=Thiolinea disciformis TaxID=125614 RepID=UPI00037F0ABD|nr:DUF4349 domain-containing protein [Thiolinea disciformis]
MKPLSLKQKLATLGSIFLMLWGARLGYGYIMKPDGQMPREPIYDYANLASFTLERKNYASSKLKAEPSPASTQVAMAVDQKYEKIGTLASVSQAYDKDEQALYDLIKKEELMIQLEQRVGLKPERQLNVALGVKPDKFDAMIAALRNIGSLRSIQIDKNDKTNEYKKLEAERVSLVKARDTLLELRQSGGNTGELIELTNQLLDIEKQIQGLGVSLGDFDVQNEFCTVKFTLQEMRTLKPVHISLLERAKVAFWWSTKVYLGFWAALSFGLFGIWLLLSIVEKVLRWNREKP